MNKTYSFQVLNLYYLILFYYLFQNKYQLITDGIDAAWIAFSAGYKRMLTKEYEKDAVLKIKKDSEGKFDYNKKDFVDAFLKEQMPLDPDWDEKEEKERVRKSKLIKSLQESLLEL